LTAARATTICVTWTAAAWAAAAAPPGGYTYTGVMNLVARAEAGDCDARAEGLAAFGRDAENPLAGAAWGRLVVLSGCDQPFVAMKYWDYWRGFRALNGYIANHGEDPTPRVWRAAAAVDTNYALWKMSDARADLEFALAAYDEDPDLPGDAARCKTLLGVIAKDEGDLAAALTWWRAAFAEDPAGPAGREAARWLALFTG